MNGLGGLFELVLVLAIVLGWGFVELRANRRDRKRAEAARSGRHEGASPGGRPAAEGRASRVPPR